VRLCRPIQLSGFESHNRSGVQRQIKVILDGLAVRAEDEYVELAVKLVDDVSYRESIRERFKPSRHVLFEDVTSIRAPEKSLSKVTRER
jgi:hypothetical protein